MLVFAKCTREK